MRDVEREPVCLRHTVLLGLYTLSAGCQRVTQPNDKLLEQQVAFKVRSESYSESRGVAPDTHRLVAKMAAPSVKLPRRLPLLIIDKVLFPGASIRIPVTSYRNMNMVKSHLLSRSTLSSAIIGVVPKQVASEDGKIHQIGTAAIVVQVTGSNWPRPSYTLLVTGLCRFKMDDLLQETPYLIGSVTQLEKRSNEPPEDISEGLKSLMTEFHEAAGRLIEILDLSSPAVARLRRLLNSLPIHSLPDVCAAIVRASHEERLAILDAVDHEDRFRLTLPLLIRQIESLKQLQKVKKDGNRLNSTAVSCVMVA